MTSNFKPIPSYKANVRQTDDKVLGVVSDCYKIVQNHEAFAFVDGLLGEGVKFEPYRVFSNTHEYQQLEYLVRDEFTKRTGIEVTLVKEILQSEAHPFMLASLYGICEHPNFWNLPCAIFFAKADSLLNHFGAFFF